ncbi:hypothetical protein AMATHDRAFT_147166 [Amanita thiersii Skay4041]|uniref:BHLH domain-containing protein n=1 Tax=Amanita thiersii Skay4041 TaxID=703135 RepID=A0A2A9NPR7_9AGAR|nr:hypothetical protein AMATHDRAFT_147166 [Amanita thiersii Skay4041]
MSQSPLYQNHVPFADFDFSFDPSLSNLFPNPPPLPSSADLFSPSETTDLLGFLDAFGDFNWDLQNAPPLNTPDPSSYTDYSVSHTANPAAPYSNPHLNTTPELSTGTRPKFNTRGGRSTNPSFKDTLTDNHHDARSLSQGPSTTTSDPSSPHSLSSSNDLLPPPLPHSSSSSSSTSSLQVHQSTISARSKPLLSTPQKRLNHIMSEQKRRNAIRDGYAQLIALLSPAGSAPTIGMPTRGRPKGSGSRGKGESKGKSGVLFRAVEYCRWLEEGRDALREEVLRLEAAAGIRHH